MKKRFIIRLFAGMVTLFLLVNCLNTVSVSAAISTIGWDLVDSGKHLDVDGNSTYMSYVWKGKDIWNAHKAGVIRKDSATVLEDVYVKDISKANNCTGTTYSNGKIELNKYYLKDCGNTQITKTATHELGHALGLGHGVSTSDIMYAYQTSKTTLSASDKESYDYVYKRY